MLLPGGTACISDATASGGNGMPPVPLLVALPLVEVNAGSSEGKRAIGTKRGKAQVAQSGALLKGGEGIAAIAEASKKRLKVFLRKGSG